MFTIEIKEEGAQRRHEGYEVKVASVPVVGARLRTRNDTERLRVNSVDLVTDPEDGQPVAIVHAARY